MSDCQVSKQASSWNFLPVISKNVEGPADDVWKSIGGRRRISLRFAASNNFLLMF